MIKDVIADRDKVVVKLTQTETHEAEYDEIPAHTKTLEVPKEELTIGSTFTGRSQAIIVFV